MSKSNGYWEEALVSIDKDISGTEDILKGLREIRATVVSHIRPTVAAIGKVWYYIVKSRTDGDGHRIFRAADGRLTCSCPSGSKRGYCWAMNGITAAIDTTGAPYFHSFNADGKTHRFVSSTHGFFDAGTKW